MNKGLLFLFTAFFLSLNAISQDKGFKELYAESFSYLELGNYRGALPILLEMYEMDKKNANTAFTIGNCYMNTQNEKPRAIPYFEAAKEKLTVEYSVGDFKEKDAPVEVIRFLGQAYHVNYEFDKALKEFKMYRDILNKNNTEDWDAVTHEIRMSRNAIDFMSKPIDVFIESAGVLNSKFSEYRPKVNAEETFLYFTTRRKGESDLIDESGRYFEDIYYSVKEEGNWTNPIRLNDSINTDSHDACLYLSPDGQMMYVYQFDGGRDAGGSIYESRLVGKEWSKPEKLIADINSEYWETDASLNTSATTIFFTSDRPGGIGEENRDIWMMKKLPTGDWARIQPLPSSVNTPYDEESPYLHPDGKTLYFSSKGHNSMGGFDVFSVEMLEDDENGRTTFGEVVNLGYPVNTTGDDVFYFPSIDGERAYFSSYREGGKGEQDIYILTYALGSSPQQGYSTSLAVHTGISKFEDGNVIKDLLITIEDLNSGEKFGEYRPNEETGKFLFVLEANNIFQITYEAQGKVVSEVVSVEENGVITKLKEVTIEDDVLIVRDVVEDSLQDNSVTVVDEVTQVMVDSTLNSGKKLVINSVMFAYDQVKLIQESQPELDKIVNYMNEYKDAKLIIDGHTDSKGAVSYNKRLSRARANKIKEYLSSAGIKVSRMETHGYGESKPIADNQNADGSDNPLGRQKNRRVEFTVKK